MPLRSRVLLCALSFPAFIALSPSVQAMGVYRLSSLGTGRVTAINQHGDVVGYCGEDVADARSFLIRDGIRYDLGAGLAVDVNETRQVILQTGLSTGALWEAGVRTDLPFLPSAINNSGQIVGGDIADSAAAFLHDTRTGITSNLRDLADWSTIFDVYGPGVDPYQRRIRPLGINDAGLIVGDWIESNGLSRGFLLDGSTLRNLGTGPGTDFIPFAINNQGEFAGLAWDSNLIVSGPYGRGELNGTLFDEHLVLELGEAISLVAGINDLGQLLAYRTSFGPVGLPSFSALLDEGVWYNLSEHLSPNDLGGWTLDNPMALNNNGEIVGWDFDPDSGDYRSWRLTPTNAATAPEPSTLALTITLAPAALLWNRRRLRSSS